MARTSIIEPVQYVVKGTPIKIFLCGKGGWAIRKIDKFLLPDMTWVSMPYWWLKMKEVPVYGSVDEAWGVVDMFLENHK